VKSVGQRALDGGVVEHERPPGGWRGRDGGARYGPSCGVSDPVPSRPGAF
jgi:hypothetical protein